ncbi:asparagine synthase-related protein [Nocardiopsis suaedae]|uniref:asparagine synthase (glutamine-hydrolyzing) n=1 Tax=Nocardiopsis suaedae TaxID=3018444 RepID=A0ABT4TFC6_9ACTN|nr:asparagine synthase-related protein [Nocardiopsis suaedae]MDA2803407.1 asparagine synthase-related protein [Nocardiopsis suaedae]
MHTPPTWFAVLPDTDDAVPAARLLTAAADRVVPHASGRPWIAGSWGPGEAALVLAGPSRLALIGRSTAGAAVLESALAGGLDRIGERTRALSGCFHLIAAVDGRVWARGASSGVRRLFHADVRGVRVLADRADALAAPGAPVDPGALALRLAVPGPGEGLEQAAPLRGVDAVPTDHAAVLGTDGSLRLSRWWEAPRPALSPEAGAPAVAEALEEAVRARTRATGTVGCDLSGGWDSTSLSLLAARSAGRLVTYRWDSSDPANDDAAWADRARALLPEAMHRVVPAAEIPRWFARLDAPSPALDEPLSCIRVRERTLHTARDLAAQGARLHMNGQGGDELFAGNSIHLHALAARAPFTAMKRAWGYRALLRWPLWATARALTDRRGHARSLRRAADALDAPSVTPRTPFFDWVLPARLPPWATPDARDAVAGRMRAAASAAPAPSAPTRAQHVKVQTVRGSGCTMRLVDQIYRSAGVELATPYLDDTVMDAVLSIDGARLCDPYRYKPLLAAAMRGVLPEELLERRTKGEFSADAFSGLREHRSSLLALTEDMRLERLGLVDSRALRAAITGPHTASSGLAAIEATLGAENWLRRAHRPQAAASPPFPPQTRIGEAT